MAGSSSQICRRRLAVAERLWTVSTRLGSFGNTLGLVLQRDGGKLKPHRIDDRATHWSVPYPPWATRKDGRLCLATALALADEVSSYGGMACWDERGRPGITISISAMLADRTEPPRVSVGEELHFVSRKLKTGRQLGYMELEIWRGAPSDDAYYHAASASASASASSSGELLAVGRHSKSARMRRSAHHGPPAAEQRCLTAHILLCACPVRSQCSRGRRLCCRH